MKLPKHAFVHETTPLVGWVLVFSGMLYLVLLFLFLFIFSELVNTAANQFQARHPVLTPIFAVFVFPLFALLPAYFLVYRGSQRLTRTAKDVLEKDHRPPIIYLRSFKEKGTIYFELSSPLPFPFETVLVNAFKKVGPVITLGEPHEKFPEIGVARLYVNNKHWKSVIMQLALEARLVVIQVGISEGIAWEEEMAIKSIAPEKLMFLFPYGDPIESLQRRISHKNPEKEDYYESFRLRVDHLLPKALPDTIGGAVFLYFDSDWYPHLVYPVGKAPTGEKGEYWLLGPFRFFLPKLFPDAILVDWKRTIRPYIKTVLCDDDSSKAALQVLEQGQTHRITLWSALHPRFGRFVMMSLGSISLMAVVAAGILAVILPFLEIPESNVGSRLLLSVVLIVWAVGFLALNKMAFSMARRLSDKKDNLSK